MQYVSLVLNILFAVFLVVGFLLGFSRGMKRTLVRSVWIVLVLVLMILLSASITESLLNMNFGLSYAGQECGSLKEYFVTVLQQELPVQNADYASLVDVVAALIMMTTNCLVFVVLYLLLKLATMPFYWIANQFIFIREKRRKKQAKKEKQKIKIKKYRLIGGAIGVLLGIISFSAVMTPVVGYISLSKKFERSTSQEKESGAVTALVGDSYNDFINEYDSAIPTKVLGAIGLEKALSGIFNNLSRAKINDEKIYLNKEADVYAKLYNKASNLKPVDLNVITQEEMDTFLKDVEEVSDIVFESKLVSAVGDTIIPFGVQYARSTIKTDSYDKYVSDFINALFDELENLKASNTQQEIKNVIGFVRVLNNYDMLIPLIKEDSEVGIEFLQDRLTKEASDEIVSSLFAISSVNKVAPAFVNFVLGFGAKSLGYEYTGENNVTSDMLQSSARVILTSAVDVLTTYDENKSTKVDLNETTVSAIGGMFDEVKKVLSAENFKNIVDSVEPKIKDIAKESFVKDNTPKFIENAMDEAIGNISEISSFKADFVNIYKAMDSISTQFKEADDNGKYDMQLIDFIKFGESLDTIQACGLFKDSLVLRAMKDAVAHYSEEFEKKLSTEEKPFSFTFDAALTSNLDELITEGVEWKKELPKYKETVGIIANLFQGDGSIVDKIKSENDNSLQKLGYELDHDLKNSKLLKNADRNLVADILTIADIKFNTDNDEDLSELLSDAKDNVLNEHVTVVWETEFYHIKTLAKQKFDDSSDANIKVIAGAIDTVVFGTNDGENEIPKSNIFTQDMINNYISGYMDKVFPDIDESDDFYDSVNQIKTSFNTKNISSYTAEITALLELKSIKDFANSGTFDFKEDGRLLGQKIDTSLSVENQVVVDKALINGFILKKIDGYFEDYNSDLQDEIKQIKAGFNDNIEKYEVEFVALGNLMKVSDITTESGFDFKDKTSAQRLGASIDTSLKQVKAGGVDYLSTIVDKDLINGYIKKYVDNNISVSNTQFGSVLTNIIGVKSVSGTETTFSEGRIDIIGDVHELNAYKTEFGYLSQLLIVSDAFSSVTLDNITEVNASLNSTLADQFDGNSEDNGRAKVLDPLRQSVLVGDSLLNVISSAFDEYKEDSVDSYTGDTKTDYEAVINEVSDNYSFVKDRVIWIGTQENAEEIYFEYKDVINALSDINTSLDSTSGITKEINSLTDLTEESMPSYDATLQRLQYYNLLLNVNGTNKLAILVLNKINKLLVGTDERVVNAKTYVSAYIQFLKGNIGGQETKGFALPYEKDLEYPDTIVYAYTVDAGTNSWGVEVDENTEGGIKLNTPFKNIYTILNTTI